MVIFMKILLPVDLRLASVDAAQRAVEIAEGKNGSVEIVHVIRPVEISAYKRNARLWQQADGSVLDQNVRLMDSSEAKEKLKEKALKILHEIVSQLDCRAVPIGTEVLIGTPSTAILQQARTEDADLIVMSSRGAPNLKRFFIGSTIQKVLSQSPCPVLVIHTAVPVPEDEHAANIRRPLPLKSENHC